ncbi:MAG: histidinol dehydrogenase [Ruminococcaceae bacterium]|nr:histidinol dehydrogenase [Oscillospiraceae bacterium]
MEQIRLIEEKQVLTVWAEMNRQTEAVGKNINAAVEPILAAVRTEGDAAVRRYTKQFDGIELDSFELAKSELDAALAAAPAELTNALERAAARIRAFHAKQLQNSWMTESADGTVLGQRVLPLERVGVYVPGGSAAYPSSVLMNIIPAKLAGVDEVIVITPPFKSERGRLAVLSAAKIAGADRVFTVGGAQAIAAVAYGTESIPKVDKITGPGNAFVAAAKSMVYGKVDIDMVAGPSEILIIADDTADAEYLAADMLSQAEHDALASSVLLTTSQRVAEETAAALKRQTAERSRREIIEKSLASNGLIVVCESLASAAEIANTIAPEHLEIVTENPMAMLPKIRNAGSIFLGAYSPEPLGDYMAGPNHVLPTSGTARFMSPLGVDSFIKKSSFIMATPELLESLTDDIVVLAENEGLDAHAQAIRVRREHPLR